MGKSREAFEAHRADIREIASRYPVTNVRVFGSVLHGGDDDTSDVDLLVDALPEATLLDLGGLQDELQRLLGLSVDLVTPGDLPGRLRSAILSEAQPV